MKKWKKISIAICSFIMVVSLNTTVFATETQLLTPNEYITQSESQNTFYMDAVSNNEDGVSPYLTIVENGGSCKLDYISSGKYLAWTVTPATSFAYTFIGEIRVYTSSTGAYKGMGLCTAAGVGSKSGIVDVKGMKLRSGVKYKAVFSGTATDTEGNLFTVSSAAVIPFTY